MYVWDTVEPKACFRGQGWRIHKRRSNDLTFGNFMLLNVNNLNLNRKNLLKSGLGNFCDKIEKKKHRILKLFQNSSKN